MTSKRLFAKMSLAWLLIVLSLLTFRAYANSEAAATVLFTHGVVTLTTATGSHDLAKGDDVPAGSTINTADKSRVQLRFTDGGLVSLMPNTEFSVDSYNQPTADDEGSISMSLVKGGLRSLSGTIGKKNKESYELKTKVATLGIRGTQYVATYEGEVMRVHVGEGSVALTNEFGELVLTPGQSAEVFAGQAPQSTQVQPQIVSTAVEEDDGGESESNDEGDSETDSSANNSDSIADSNDAGVSGNADSANSISHALPLALVDEGAVEEVAEEAQKRIEEENQKEPAPEPAEPEPTEPPVTEPPVTEPPVKKYVMAYYSADSKYAGNPSDTESNKPDAKEAAVLESLQSTFKDINESLELEGENFGEFQVKVINGNDGSVTKVGNGLIWGEVDVEYQEDFNGDIMFHQEKVFFVIAEHSSDLPATGILSYRLSNDPSHKSEVYTGDPDNQYTLQQLDLDLFIKSQSDVKANIVLVIIEDDPQNPSSNAVVGMETYNPINVTWSSDGNFKLNATDDNGSCYPVSSCSLWLSGVLADDDQDHAGVVYKIINNGEGMEYSGAAALELVPELDRRLVFATISGPSEAENLDDFQGNLNRMHNPSGPSSDEYDFGLRLEGNSYADVDLVVDSDFDINIETNLRHSNGLVWGEYSILDETAQELVSKHFLVFGERTTLPMSGGTLFYELSQATNVYNESSGNFYSLERFNLAITLAAGSNEHAEAAVDMQLDLGTHQLAFNGSDDGLNFNPNGGFDVHFYDPSDCEGCSLNISGVLNGVNHERAGVVYQLQQEIPASGIDNSYIGAALLKSNQVGVGL